MTRTAANIDDPKRRRCEVIPQVLVDDLGAGPSAQRAVVTIHEPTGQRRPGIIRHTPIIVAGRPSCTPHQPDQPPSVTIRGALGVVQRMSGWEIDAAG